MSIADCTIYEHTCADEPTPVYCEGEDDPILASALRRAGMKFDSNRGWYWPEESEDMDEPEEEPEAQAQDLHTIADEAQAHEADCMCESCIADAFDSLPWVGPTWEDEPGYMESTAPYLF
jgi:hypothetical protein